MTIDKFGNSSHIEEMKNNKFTYKYSFHSTPKDKELYRKVSDIPFIAPRDLTITHITCSSSKELSHLMMSIKNRAIEVADNIFINTYSFPTPAKQSFVIDTHINIAKAQTWNLSIPNIGVPVLIEVWYNFN